MPTNSFESNTASEAGGAIYANSTAIIKGINSVLERNSAKGSDGGGVYSIGECMMTWQSTIFEKNTAFDNGGAVAINNMTTTNFENCLLKDNFALTGIAGGIYLADTANLSSINFNLNI